MPARSFYFEPAVDGWLAAPIARACQISTPHSVLPCVGVAVELSLGWQFVTATPGATVQLSPQQSTLHSVLRTSSSIPPAPHFHRIAFRLLVARFCIGRLHRLTNRRRRFAGGHAIRIIGATRGDQHRTTGGLLERIGHLPAQSSGEPVTMVSRLSKPAHSGAGPSWPPPRLMAPRNGRPS